VYIWDDDLAGALGWDGLDRRGIIELEIEAWYGLGTIWMIR
jgi:hypothetical protein